LSGKPEKRLETSKQIRGLGFKRTENRESVTTPFNIGVDLVGGLKSRTAPWMNA